MKRTEDAREARPFCDPIFQPIALITSLVVILTMIGVLALITVKGWWPYLWREWIRWKLSEHQIAAVLTYIRNTWTNAASSVAPE